MLTIFWGKKEDKSFTWRLSAGPGKEPSPEISESSPLDNYQLESHEILKADLACIADMASTRDVRLILSSCDVFFAKVDAPKKGVRVLRKAVPYMLEDDVATSVDKMFFAFADKNKESLLSVRAIDRTYLEAIIESFKTLEIRLVSILVDLDLISPPEEGIKLLLSDSECLSVDAQHHRWHCHQVDYRWFVQKQIKAEKTEAEQGKKGKKGEDGEDGEENEEHLPIAEPLDIYSDQPVDEFEAHLPPGKFAAQHKEIDDIYDYILGQNEKGINFLQAEYEVKKENSKINHFLVQVATIAGFVLAAHLLTQGISIYTLSAKKTQLEQQQITLYKQAFPNDKRARTPVKTMRIYVKSLGSSSGDSDFLTLLNSSSELLTDLSKIYPTNINYNHSKSELRMDVIASDLVVLDKYAETLKASGHQVEKSSETQRGEGYSSRLTIRK